ncbi:DUF4179 domain-containing protein [Paenibacillus sp. MMS20-IR301]|uniref:DUF4179 domain-containing protein n=1 Tax=Paenibacillus sp. MMS20-IR301 TaxID=2895946 RepID=UPI0028E2178C|nr:DUF4179 domain-containing protein [Paenibacillus sp. MMS20-IR301]WNS45622.1 DUF4179 domain-containing protein [Paenibacillus sp. MMS20-IR301]
MNNSREEQLLLADAARIHGEAEADTGSLAIRRAVQSGIEQGGWESWRRRLQRGSFVGLAAAALVAVILFFLPLLQDSAPQPEAPRAAVNWGGLEMFKRLYPFDHEAPTLDSAIRHNYVQMINQSAGAEGYQITLNAVMADENRIILLYTAKVTAGQEIYNISSARIKDLSTGFYLDSEDQIGAHDERTGPEENRIYYGRGVISLDRNKPFPGKLEADFQISSVDPGKLKDPKTGTIAKDMHYSPRLHISFKLDPKFKQQPTIIVEPKEDFILDGIEMTLAKVEISPLLIRSEVVIKNESDVTWQNRQKTFLAATGDELQSVTKDGTVQLKMSTGLGNYEGYERRFASNLLDQPESIKLIMRNDNGKEKYELSIPVWPE